MMQGKVQKMPWFLALVYIMLSWVPVTVFAQLSTGTILGVVRDTTGAVVPGVAITIQNVGTGFTRTAISSDDGSYRAPALPVGTYNVRFELTGFQTQAQQGLVLDVSQEVVVNAALVVGATSEAVTVTGEAPLVNTTNNSLGGLVNTQQVSELPLNGRNYVELSLLQAGVQRAVNVIVASGIGGVQYSSNGAPLRSNAYLLDGAQLQSFYGLSGNSVANTQLGVDGIREFKLVTANFSAEYGLVMGSQMVMVSKGGTNDLHGGLFEYLRNAAVDARHPFDFSYQTTGRRVPQYQRNNFGAFLGGPIKKDKTFYFGVYEGVREAKGTPTLFFTMAGGCRGPAGTVLTNAPCPQLQLPAATPSVTISPVAARLLVTYPLPNLPNNQFGATVVAHSTSDYGQMRVDHIFSAADSFFARYTIENSAADRLGNVHPAFIDVLDGRNQFLTASENHVFSPTLLNDFRTSFSRTFFYGDTNVTDPAIADPSLIFLPELMVGTKYPQLGNITIQQGGLVTIGKGPTSPHGAPQNIYTMGDDILYTRGAHALKFGVLFNRYEPTVRRPPAQVHGGATFSSLANFMTGTLLQFTGALAPLDKNRTWRWYTFGSYIQDDWRIVPRLTLNLGLRYEPRTDYNEIHGKMWTVKNILVDATPTHTREFANNSMKDFSPRFGLAWDVFGHGKTSLRAGYGLYYDLVSFNHVIFSHANNAPPLVRPVLVSNVPMTLPFVIPASAGDILSGIYWTDPNLGQPRLHQWNLSIGQELPAKMALELAYAGTKGTHLYAQREGNPCTPTLIDANGPFWQTPCGLGRANPRYGSVNGTDATGESRYNGLQITVKKALNHGLQFQSSYTWSKLLDNAQGATNGDGSGQRFYVAANGDTSYNKGLSAFDVTHNWRFNMLYHLPTFNVTGFFEKMVSGWWTGNIVSAQSGYPFNVVSAGSRSQSQAFSNFADLVNRSPSYDKDRVILSKTNQWFDVNMFELEPLGRLGNAGRNSLRGPGFFNWDFSLNKDTKFPLLGEAGALQFRAEVFNILNHPNFALARNQQVFTGAGTRNTSAGVITSLQAGATPRDIQFALRLTF